MTAMEGWSASLFRTVFLDGFLKREKNLTISYILVIIPSVTKM